MWVYRKESRFKQDGAETGKNVQVFLVGFYVMALDTDSGQVVSHFVEINEFRSEYKAQEEVNYLNGGSPIIEVKGAVDIGNIGL